MARPAKLNWNPCVDEVGGASLIAYSQGYVCAVLFGGTRWTILSMDDTLGGTVVQTGKNPPGPISTERTATYVNRKFAEFLKAK